MARHRKEDGAAAVEFALIVPLLLVFMLAIIDLGWVFNQQLRLTAAAREGARIMAIYHEDSTAATKAQTRITAVAGAGTTVTFPTTCGPAPDDQVTVVVAQSMSDLTGWLTALAPNTLEGRGSMRCGG